MKSIIMKRSATSSLVLAASALAIFVASQFTYASAATTDAPATAFQGGDFYNFKVGAVTVTALSDGSVPQDLHELLHKTNSKKIDFLLKRSFQANPVEASINAYFLKSDGKLILIDTGAGDFFGPGYGGKLTLSLASIGVKPEQITDILLTHAHDDHMGGLVHAGKRVFPNAIVHLSKADFDFFMNRANSEKSHYAMSYFDQAETALKPEKEAGKIQTFEGIAEIVSGITASPHPGHTPGSVFYTLRSEGESLQFVGDIVHVASVQGPSPEVTIAYDVDEKTAAIVRRESFSKFANDRTLIAVPHLSFPGVGHIEKVGTGYRWVPVVYENRGTEPNAVSKDPHKDGEK